MVILRSCKTCVHHESCEYYGNSGTSYMVAYYDDMAEKCPLYKEKTLLAIGDKVYQTDGVRIYESMIKNVIFCAGNIAFDKDAIGGSVFLSEEEAEKELERREKLG